VGKGKDSQLKSMLNSKQAEETIEGLYELRSLKNKIEANLLKKDLLGLLGSPNPEIRELAASVLGVTYCMPDAYETLKSMLVGREKNQDVLMAVCEALTSLLQSGVGNSSEISSRLAFIVLDSSFNSGLRGVAHLSLRRINSDIALTDYARAPTDINDQKVNLEWVRDFTKSNKQ